MYEVEDAEELTIYGQIFSEVFCQRPLGLRSAIRPAFEYALCTWVDFRPRQNCYF
jgi:hypothetical protein